LIIAHEHEIRPTFPQHAAKSLRIALTPNSEVCLASIIVSHGDPPAERQNEVVQPYELFYERGFSIAEDRRTKGRSSIIKNTCGLRCASAGMKVSTLLATDHTVQRKPSNRFAWSLLAFSIITPVGVGRTKEQLSPAAFGM
jgi:hypothetical protein